MLYMQENFSLQLSAMVFNLEQSLSKRRHYRHLGMDNSLPVGWMAGGSVGEGGQAESAGRGPAPCLVRPLAASLVSTQTMLVAHPPH